MAHSNSSDELRFFITPRRGGILRVLIVARISTVHQDVRSLADQIGYCKAYVAARYGGPVEYLIVQGQGSGEHLDRQDLADTEELIESRTLDLVIVEDLGRICRRNRALDICEMAQDADTRLIAINDYIDTAQPNWRLNAFFASFKHEMSNADTAARIRRSLRERFKDGGVIQFTIYGYIKPEGAKSDADLRKDPEAESVYDAVFTRLEEGASFLEVADWLNGQNVKPGPYARSDRWDGRMLARVVFNQILKGLRIRNDRMSKRVNDDGHRKSIKAPPAERLERLCPHLAFIDPDRSDRVIAKLMKRSENYKRSSRTGVDVRQNVPRRHTAWPGQHAVCGCCGRLFYWGGHGQAAHMMCAGARDWKCWNTCSFDGVAGVERIGRAILERIERLPEFDEEFRGRIEARAAALRDGTSADERRLREEEVEVIKQIERGTDAIVKMGHSDALEARVRSLETRLVEIRSERAELKLRRAEIPALPPLESLKQRARDALGSLSANDREFGRLMRTLVSQLRVYPFRAIDTGRVVARALVTLDLATLLPKNLELAADSVLRQTFWVHLHDLPQYIALRESVAELRAGGLTEREVGARLGIHQPVVQRAMKLHRLMQARGTTDAYEPLTIPPDDNPKFRLHKHPRYRYEPLPGFPVWPSEIVG
jgi:DNA invertase Pin-like site-specific DNA recombinase